MNTFTVIDTTNDMMPMLDTIATQHRKNGNKLESLVSKKKHTQHWTDVKN